MKSRGATLILPIPTQGLLQVLVANKSICLNMAVMMTGPLPALLDKKWKNACSVAADFPNTLLAP